MNKTVIIVLIFVLWIASAFLPLQQPQLPPKTTTAPLQADIWVDSMYNSMSDDERLGQLFMIRAHSDKGLDHINEVKRQIQQYHIGGLCFFQGGPIRQALLINQYQALSKTPLLVSMDAEWGLGMRLRDSTISYPKQMMLGAIEDDQLLFAYVLLIH